MPEQASLPFAPRVAGPSPYRPSTQQEEAAAALRILTGRLRQAPSGLTTIVLAGPAGSGKSRLVQALHDGEDPLPAAWVPVQDEEPMEIFAAINEAAAAREVLVLEARTPPARWFAGRRDEVPPDVVSRLAAVSLLTLDRPGAAALLPVLRADLDLHGAALTEDEMEEVAENLPRHFGAPRRFCRALDAASGCEGRRSQLRWALEQVQQGHRTEP